MDAEAKDQLDAIRCAIATLTGAADDPDLPARLERELWQWQTNNHATLTTND